MILYETLQYESALLEVRNCAFLCIYDSIYCDSLMKQYKNSISDK